MLCSHHLACARRCLWDVGGSALVAGELAAMLGHWQQPIGVGTLLRWAADSSMCTACSQPRVNVGGGLVALALLVLLGLHSSAMVGYGGSALVGYVGASAVVRWRGNGIVTVLVPARWCQRRRDLTINIRWKG